MTDMTADEILASMTGDEAPAPTETKPAVARARRKSTPVTETVTETTEEVKQEVTEPGPTVSGKRTRKTAHEVAMEVDVQVISAHLGRNLTAVRTDEVRYMRALFALREGDEVLMSGLTVNEINLLARWHEALDAKAEIAEAA